MFSPIRSTSKTQPDAPKKRPVIISPDRLPGHRLDFEVTWGSWENPVIISWELAPQTPPPSLRGQVPGAPARRPAVSRSRRLAQDDEAATPPLSPARIQASFSWDLSTTFSS